MNFGTVTYIILTKVQQTYGKAKWKHEFVTHNYLNKICKILAYFKSLGTLLTNTVKMTWLGYSGNFIKTLL